MKAEGYKQLLLDLLAIIHRDGGQYTVLAGLPESIIDAEAKVVSTREALASAMRTKRKTDE